MGGYGSGRWDSHSKRTTVEECYHIDVRHLRRRGILKEGQTWRGLWVWRNARGEEEASVGLVATTAQVALAYTIRFAYNRNGEPELVNYTVPVVWTPMFGSGTRPWFLCPGRDCGRRVAKLYCPDSGRYYLCRHCYDLSYKSRQTWDKRAAFYGKHPELALAVMRSPAASHAERMAAMKGGLKGL